MEKGYAAESEEIPDSFLCCVCLDLMYKPVVLACGHISCFWCVHLSMNHRAASSCPICRHRYTHFPTICWMLHFLIVKMYPVAYKRREDQILVEEKRRDCFSPQPDYSSYVSLAYKEYDHLRSEHSRTRSLESSSCSNLCLHKKGDTCARMEQRKPVSVILEGDMSISEPILDDDCKDCKEVSTADVQCPACKQLLFRPVVLNCGHVYCETCIPCPVDKMLRCQVCQSLHPSSFPKVCLEFNRFLEENFSTDYALRRDAVRLKHVHIKSTTNCSTNASKNGHQFSLMQIVKDLPSLASPRSSTIHARAGCDSCGVYPIVGDRYKCKDCIESIGFDLCGDCYNTRSKVPGRFNQQHTPEHKFELVKNHEIPVLW